MKHIVHTMILLILSFFLFCAQETLPVSAEEDSNTEITLSVSYNMVTTRSVGTFDITFDKNWFKEPATNYNHKLAQASLGLACASFRPSSYDPVKPSDKRVSDFLSDLGFEDIRTDDYDRPAGRYTIASGMGHQKIGEGDDSFELIVVGIAGQGYGSEWLSNFSIGAGSLHEGFSDAADDIYDRFFGYLAENHIEKPYKVWISGFSRSAAVTNIFAAYLEQDNILPDEDVFAYSFATPRTTKKPEPGRHNNIFNIVGMVDPVPQVPFRDWGFERYGITYYTPCQESDPLWYSAMKRADKVYSNLVGFELWNNPYVNTQLKMFTEYLLEICPTSEIYAEHLQDRMLYLWGNHTPAAVLSSLIDISQDDELINDNNRADANSLLDFALYILLDYTMRSDTMGYYENRATVAANVVHEHTPEVYIGWMFSSDDPEDIFTDNDTYRRVVIDGSVDAEIIDPVNNALLQTIDVNGNVTYQSDKTRLYASRTGGKTTIILPVEWEFDITLTPRLNETVRIISINYTSEQTTITEYRSTALDVKSGEPITLSYERYDYSDAEKNAEEIRNMQIEAGGYLEQILAFERLNVFHLSWRNFTILIISILAFLNAMLVFGLFYSAGLFRFRSNYRKGCYEEGTKYYALPVFCLSLVFACFLTQEFFAALFPNIIWVKTLFKSISGILILYSAWHGFRHNPSVLNKWALPSLIFIVLSDLAINYHTELGILLRSVGMVLMTIGLIRNRRPKDWMYALFVTISYVTMDIFIDTGLLHSSVWFVYAVDFIAATGLFIASFNAPGRFRVGALLMFIASGLLMLNTLRVMTFVSHLASAGIYYASVVSFAAGMVKLLKNPRKPEPETLAKHESKEVRAA